MKNKGATIMLMLVLTILIFLIGSVVVNEIRKLLSDEITSRYISNGDYSNAAIDKYSSIYGVISAIIGFLPVALIIWVDTALWRRHKKLNKENQ